MYFKCVRKIGKRYFSAYSGNINRIEYFIGKWVHGIDIRHPLFLYDNYTSAELDYGDSCDIFVCEARGVRKTSDVYGDVGGTGQVYADSIKLVKLAEKLEHHPHMKYKLKPFELFSYKDKECVLCEHDGKSILMGLNGKSLFVLNKPINRLRYVDLFKIGCERMSGGEYREISNSDWDD